MATSRFVEAERAIVEISEKLAVNDETKDLTRELEEDLKSISSLFKWLNRVQMGNKAIQQVFAHLLDHVIDTVMILIEDSREDFSPEDAPLILALDDYMHQAEVRFSRKSSGVRSEDLGLVFENYWSDAEESELIDIADDDPDFDDDDEEEDAKSVMVFGPGVTRDLDCDTLDLED